MSATQTPVDRARAAYRAKAGAEAEAQAEHDKLAEMLRTQRNEQDERERLRAAEDHDAAVRLVDGEDAAPRKARRVNRLAVLDENAPAHAAAIQIQRSRIAEAGSATASPMIPLVVSILDVMEEVQGDAVESVRAALAELRDPLARLIAADQIKLATIGDRFPVPAGRTPPFSGLAIVRKLLVSLPDRLKPPELAESALLDAAHEISSATISQIKES